MLVPWTGCETMAAQAPDLEMDHEYDQIVFSKTDSNNQARASQSNPEFVASTPHGASLYPQLLRQLLQENDWGRYPVYKMEVLQQQEQAIAGMNIPPVELLKQVQGGNVYSSQTLIRSYEDAVMATAFMPGMFNEDEAIPEFKPRIHEKTVSPVKKVDTAKSSSTDSETEPGQTVKKVVPKYGKKAQSYRLSKSMFDRLKMFKKNTREGVVRTLSEPECLNAMGLTHKSLEAVTKPTETDFFGVNIVTTSDCNSCLLQSFIPHRTFNLTPQIFIIIIM